MGWEGLERVWKGWTSEEELGKKGRIHCRGAIKKAKKKYDGKKEDRSQGISLDQSSVMRRSAKGIGSKLLMSMPRERSSASQCGGTSW